MDNADCKPTDTIGELLRLRHELAGGRAPTPRELRLERRRIARTLRDGKRRWAEFKRARAAGENPPLFPTHSKVRAQTHAMHKNARQVREALEHNVGRDLEYLRKYRTQRERYAHLPKPWKGKAGRKAARSANRGRGNATADQVRTLASRGMTPHQVAERAGKSLSTVYRNWPT